MSRTPGFYVRGLPVSDWNVPDVGVMPDGLNFVLRERFIYISKSGETYWANPGLRTDGGSIPPIFWRTVGSPWTGKRRYAYIIHDQLCEDLAKLPLKERDKARKIADDLLLEMCQFLEEGKVGLWIWLGVRVGWKFWIRWHQTELPPPKAPRHPHLYGTRKFLTS